MAKSGLLGEHSTWNKSKMINNTLFCIISKYRHEMLEKKLQLHKTKIDFSANKSCTASSLFALAVSYSKTQYYM